MVAVYIDPLLKCEGCSLTQILSFSCDRQVDLDSRYAIWRKVGGELIELVPSRSQANIAIIPHNLCEYLHNGQMMPIVREVVRKNVDAGLLTWAFLWSDLNDPIDLGGVRIFRTGGYASRSYTYEEGMPSFCEDLRGKYCARNFVDTAPVERLSVSFCGNADGKKSLWQHFCYWRSSNEGEVGRKLRRKTMRILEEISFVHSYFHTFDSFFVGENMMDETERRKRRELFVLNMLASNYALVVRGTGNYSYRHYEAMSLGRVPLFIDSDCLLPLNDLIDWDSVMCIVSENNLGDLTDQFLRFDEKCDDIVRVGEKAREIWQNYLTPEGFFRSILIDQRRMSLGAL